MIQHSSIHEKSFGIIPLKLIKGEWHFLLVQPLQGWWGFPKGHANQEELDLDAAIRELFEETGLHIKRLISQEPQFERYQFFSKGKLITKTVAYWPAEVMDDEVKVQEEEIKSYLWLKVDQAIQQLTYEEAKQLCQKVHQIL